MKGIELYSLKDILEPARKGGYAVGSFSPRYCRMIRPIIKAAIATDSPVIVQISEKELKRHKVDIKTFSDTFFSLMEELNPSVPVTLHLDHTKDFEIIKDAIAVGFSSVMIDASELDFEENIRTTTAVVEYAHSKGVSVEAELGRIGTTDFVETDTDEEQYTVPEEAEEFCRRTNVDALAVSVGTAHGVYTVKKPKIAYEYLDAMNRLFDVPLVLHGGSGVPSEMVTKAVTMPGGGVSKVNIATDLELAALGVLGRTGHMTDAEMDSFESDALDDAEAAVQVLVEDRIRNYILSSGKADLYR